MSCAESMSRLCDLQDMLIWNEPSHKFENMGSQAHTLFVLLLARTGRDVDHLLMAKLDAISTLGNPPWPGARYAVAGLQGSSLRRP